MIPVFDGNTANDVWLQAATMLQEDNQDVQIQPSRGGTTRELLHAALSIRDPKQRWVVAREPGINPAFAIAEVVWIMNGRNDAAFLKPWNTQLSKFVGSADHLHGAYGFRLRKHFSLDQLERAYKVLSAAPNSRQTVLQLWDCKSDLPNEIGEPANDDIPCNIVSMLKVRDGKLEWMQVMRSNDLFRGTPYNFVQFTALQEIMAGWLDLDLGSYNHVSDSLHIYENEYSIAPIDCAFDAAKSLDSLALPKEDSSRVFLLLSELIERLAAASLSESELPKILRGHDLPLAYTNMLSLVAAEAARRRGWTDVARGIADECKNPLLQQAWQRWSARFRTFASIAQ
jgi:thymidylate synthase